MNTTVRGFRLGDDLWDYLNKRADKEGKKASDVMRELILKDICDNNESKEKN